MHQLSLVLLEIGNAMYYPLHVWKNQQGAYSARFPDLPDILAGADSLTDLPAAAQAAFATALAHGTEMADASSVEQWCDCTEYAGGFWMLVEIDLSKINLRSVRVNITLPEKLLNDIDVFTKSRNWTRSGFLAQAALKAMAQ
jgi:predicted RNase H-like HicB family nuclease